MVMKNKQFHPPYILHCFLSMEGGFMYTLSLYIMQQLHTLRHFNFLSLKYPTLLHSLYIKTKTYTHQLSWGFL